MHALTTSSFPQSMIARLVLNLLKSRDIIAVLQRSIAFDAFLLWHTRIFLNVWKQSKFNVINSKHFLLLACPCLQRIHFNLPYNRIAHITFYTESKRLINYYILFPLHHKQLRPWVICNLDDPWSFVASNFLMHSVHRCTWE